MLLIVFYKTTAIFFQITKTLINCRNKFKVLPKKALEIAKKTHKNFAMQIFNALPNKLKTTDNTENIT